jgi:hypothetical protein
MQEYALGFATTGAFFALSGAYQLWRGFGTSGWSAAPGEITGGFVYETEEDRDDDDRPYDNRKQSFFVPRVMYKYVVRGKEHEGDTLQRGIPRLPFEALAQNRAEGYRPGQHVTVYYWPRDPSQAVLKRGAPIDGWVMLAAGVVMLLAAIAAK